MLALLYSLSWSVCRESEDFNITAGNPNIYHIAFLPSPHLDLAVFGQCDDEPLNKSHLLVAFASMLTFVRQV